jgi:hypothetical protein
VSRTRLAAAFVVVFAAGFLAAADDPKSGVIVDAAKKSVSIDAKVAPRKLAHLDQIYPIEVVACWAHPKGQKAHETVVTFEAKPSEVHKALESVGLKPGKPAKGEGTSAEGPEVSVFIEVPAGGGPGKRLSIDKFLLDPKTKKPFPKNVKFKFTGSVMSQEAPDKPEKVYGADLTGTLVAIFPVTDQTVLQSSLTMKEEKYLKLEVNTEALPKEGSPVKLVIEAAGK